jgi:hypothetical protein
MGVPVPVWPANGDDSNAYIGFGVAKVEGPPDCFGKKDVELEHLQELYEVLSKGDSRFDGNLALQKMKPLASKSPRG